MSDILTEVEEQIKQEKIANIIRKSIIPIVLLVICIVAIYYFYTYKQEKFRQDQAHFSVSYYKALEEKDTKALAKLVSLQNANFSAMAALNLVNLFDKKPSVLESIIKNKKYNSILVDLAKLQLGNEQYRLSSDSAFSILDKLLVASNLLAIDKKEEAKRYLTELVTDKNTPTEILKYSKILLELNWQEHE